MTPLQAPPPALLERYHGLDFQPLYATSVTVAGGEASHGRASGVARSDDGQLSMDLRLPSALWGPGGGTNPEQLLAAAYAASFHGALGLLAARDGIAIPDATVRVSVTFGRDPVDGLYMLTAQVSVHLPGVDQCVAEELIRNAERVCPYAKMSRQGLASLVMLEADG